MRLLTNNLASDSTTVLTASSADPSFPVSNLKHQFRSKRWRATGCASESVTFDMLTTEPVNSVVILWPKEDGIKLTSSAVIKIQANATNVWTSPAIDQTLSVNDTYSVASHFFTTEQNYRYWRLVVTDATNPWGYIEIGKIWIGTSLSLQNAENGFKFRLKDQSKSTTTDFGHRYSDEYPITTLINIFYKYLNYSEVQEIENAYRNNGSRKPIIVVQDPEAVVFDKDHFLIYGTMSDELDLSHVRYTFFDIPDLVIEELS